MNSQIKQVGHNQFKKSKKWDHSKNISVEII